MKELTKESIRELPLIQYEGPIHVVNDEKSLKKAISYLKKFTVLGFDTEKKPTFKKGEYNHPALIQLATDEAAYIFQLPAIGFHSALRDLFSNPNILKLGVAVRDDLVELKRMEPFTPGGFIDLARLAKEQDIPYFGLRNLTAFFLDGRLSKSQQTSNWENETLTEPQKIYAATDAWVALRIYEGLTAQA
ncbi:MAG: 3'-5' exonuclease [Cyclobacteriaceae bacterium]